MTGLQDHFPQNFVTVINDDTLFASKTSMSSGLVCSEDPEESLKRGKYILIMDVIYGVFGSSEIWIIKQVYHKKVKPSFQM